jgi:hypothetical protein
VYIDDPDAPDVETDAAITIGWTPPDITGVFQTATDFFEQAAEEAREHGLDVTVVSRLRKNAALWNLPPQPKPGERRRRGQPRKYGTQRISVAKRAGRKQGWQTVECVQYNKPVTKTIKTFLATYRPAYGTIRVVIVQEEHGCEYFFSTDPDDTPRQILEDFADRATIEQDFHDVKEVWGAGQQQVRNLWANIGCWHLCLWMHTLVELWAWNQPHEAICDRSASPWDNPDRRPSHADRLRALRQETLRQEYSHAAARARPTQKIRRFIEHMLMLAS